MNSIWIIIVLLLLPLYVILLSAGAYVGRLLAIHVLVEFSKNNKIKTRRKYHGQR